MPIPVPGQPSSHVLESFQVGEPASAVHFRAQIQTINHLRAGIGQVLASVAYHEAAFTAPATVKYTVLFVPSYGAQVARLQCEMHPHTQGNKWHFSAVEIDGVAATVIATSPSPYKGHDMEVSATNQRLRSTHIAYVSLAGLDITAPHELTLTLSNTNDTHGLASLSLIEVPFGLIDPNGYPSSEVGANEAWPDARSRLFEGTDETGGGTQRLIEELRRIRIYRHWHWQIATPEHDSYAIKRAAAVGSGIFDFQGSFGTSYEPTWTMRARKLAAITNGAKFYARYKWNGVAGTANIMLTTETSEDDFLTVLSSAAVQLSLVNTAGGYVVGTSSALPIPLDGPGQRVRVRVEADNDSNDLHITNLALVEYET